MNTLLKKLKYNALAGLKMDLWMPRADKHPQLIATPQANIAPAQQIRINARCLVLLYSQHKSETLEPAAQTILQGMLSVLELQLNEIMTATVYAPCPSSQEIEAQIQQWQPKTILQLDMEMPMLPGANCIQTYSPGYLLQNPKSKAEAYKQLLILRAMLHGTSKRNS